MSCVFILIAFIVVAFTNVMLFVYRRKKGSINSDAIKDNQPTKDKTVRIFLICASAIFIAFYTLRLFSNDWFYNVSVTQPNALFDNNTIVYMTMLRYFTQAMLIFLFIAPFFKSKTVNYVVGVFGSIIALSNIIFFKQHLMCFEGASYSFFSYRAFQFSVEVIISAVISSVYLAYAIKSKSFKLKTKTYWITFAYAFLSLLCLGVMTMFPSTPYTLFGATAQAAEGFELTHRLCLYAILIAGLGGHFIIRNKPKETKYLVCLMVAISGMISFFITYTWNIPLTALPLHLCNAAIIIGFFAFIFKSKKLFYFTYFVNVLGAICALTMPDTDGSLFLSSNIRFWLTHISVVLVPLWAVAWEVFPRPNIKMMKNSIIVFSVYFVIAALSNMLISNVDPGVNYFFLNNSFFIDKFPFAMPLRANFAYTFSLWGMSLTWYPLYWVAIYVIYIGAMFLIWLVYAYIYKVADSIKYARMLSRIDRLDMLKFKKDVLKGGNINMPINKDLKGKIQIKNFTKIYGNSKVPAVKNFNLTIEKGQVFGFLGHNGAGKSTLIKSMVGIQSITSGSIAICGYDIVQQPLQAKLNLGYVSDNHAVYEKLTGREYINFVADLYLVNKSDRDERLKEYAELFNLSGDIDREIKGYSHGMKQKLVVIASIIHNPKVWVLDEPLTGLDPMSAHQIKALMRKKADEGAIVFFSSHVIEVVEKICDKIAIINHGNLKGVYSIEDIKNCTSSLEDLYLGVNANEGRETINSDGIIEERVNAENKSVVEPSGQNKNELKANNKRTKKQ